MFNPGEEHASSGPGMQRVGTAHMCHIASGRHGLASQASRQRMHAIHTPKRVDEEWMKYALSE